MITKDQFTEFVNVFRRRYSADKMDESYARAWYKNTSHLEWEKFQQVYEKLIGDKDWPFSWGDVIRLYDAMFPKTNPYLRPEKPSQNNSEKRREFARVITQFTTIIKEAKRKRQSVEFNWKEEAARQAVKIWGKAGASQIRKDMIKNQTEWKDGKKIYYPMAPEAQEFCDFLGGMV